MAKSIIRIDDLSDAISEIIDEMKDDVIRNVNEAAEEASSQGVKDLKASSPVRTDGYNRKKKPGTYAKGWRKTKTKNALGVESYTIHNTEGQLTHLLEFGHVDAKTGKRVGIRPHIAKVNESASAEFVRKVENIKL